MPTLWTGGANERGLPDAGQGVLSRLCARRRGSRFACGASNGTSTSRFGPTRLDCSAASRASICDHESRTGMATLTVGGNSSPARAPASSNPTPSNIRSRGSQAPARSDAGSTLGRREGWGGGSTGGIKNGTTQPEFTRSLESVRMRGRRAMPHFRRRKRTPKPGSLDANWAEVIQFFSRNGSRAKSAREVQNTMVPVGHKIHARDAGEDVKWVVQHC